MVHSNDVDALTQNHSNDITHVNTYMCMYCAHLFTTHISNSVFVFGHDAAMTSVSYTCRKRLVKKVIPFFVIV